MFLAHVFYQQLVYFIYIAFRILDLTAKIRSAF